MENAPNDPSSATSPSSAFVDECPTASSPSIPSPTTSTATASEAAEPPQKVIQTSNGTGKKPRKPRVVLSGTRDEILARNTQSAPPAVVEKLVKQAGLNWHKFYRNHATSSSPFFKDRHWTEEAWDIGGILAPGEPEGSSERGKGKAVLEVGCGTGAFIYPLLEHYPGARFVAFDFARKAVELTKEHPLHNPSRVYAFQHDLTLPTANLHDLLASSPSEFGEAVHSFDIVSAIFVLSALAPRTQAQAVETLVSLLKPGASLLFRDYALHDAAQLRFHSLPSASYASTPSLLSPRTAPSSEPAAPPSSSSSSSSSLPSSSDPPASAAVDESNLPWYKRGDNTFTFFFTPEDISTLISRAVASLNERSGANKGDEAFIELEGGVEVVEREMYNRAEAWGCTRRFVHGSWKRVKQV